MEIPDLPISGALAHVLRDQPVAMHTIMLDKTLQPVKRQYEIGPGDKVVVASTESPIDSSIMIAEVLDPEEHKTQFPDFPDRVLRSYLLVRWRCRDQVGENADQEYLGWIYRAKMIPVTEEQYEEVNSWIIDNRIPEDAPTWLEDLYKEFHAQLAAGSPETVPIPAVCEECGSDKVDFHYGRIYRSVSRAAVVSKDGKQFYMPIHTQDTDTIEQAHLHCESCGAQARLDQQEYTTATLDM